MKYCFFSSCLFWFDVFVVYDLLVSSIQNRFSSACCLLYCVSQAGQQLHSREYRGKQRNKSRNIAKNKGQGLGQTIDSNKKNNYNNMHNNEKIET